MLYQFHWHDIQTFLKRRYDSKEPNVQLFTIILQVYREQQPKRGQEVSFAK